MPLRTPVLILVAVAAATSAAAQNAPNPGASTAATPVAARLDCPAADQVVAQDPATFTWNAGTNTPSYRLLLGPAIGDSSAGDSSLISGTKGQLAGLPPGKSLYVTLWSYDASGNAVQPASFCLIKTAPQAPLVTFKDTPSSSLSGVSLGSFAVPGSGEPAQASQACQSQCKLNAACQGYTYYPAGNGNPTAMCDLKSQITESQQNECCLSALKSITPQAPLPPPPAPVATAAPAPTKNAKASKAPKAAPAPTKVAKAAPEPTKTAKAAPDKAAPEPTKIAKAIPPEPPKPESSAPAPDAKAIAGEWVNQFGAVTKIEQKGNNITGSYSDPKLPGVSGSLKGTYDGETLHATLNWKNGADSSYGTLNLTMTPLNRLEGTWTDAAGVSGPWNMRRPGDPIK